MNRKIQNNTLTETYKVNTSALLEFNSKQPKDERYVFWEDKKGFFYTYTDLLTKYQKSPDMSIMKDFGMFTIHNVNTNNNVSFVFSSATRDEFGDVDKQIWESTINSPNGKKWTLIINVR